jgi:hypothetical protein
MPNQMKIQVGIPPMRTVLFRELPTGGESESDGTRNEQVAREIWKRGLLLPTRFFAVSAVSWVERAQPTVGVCTLNL